MLPLLLPALLLLNPQAASEKPKAKKAKATVKKAEAPAPMPEGVKAVIEEAQAAQKKHLADFQAHKAAGKAGKDFRGDLSKELTSFQERQKTATDPEVKQALILAELFLRKVLVEKPSEDLVALVKKEVPSTAWGWAVDPTLLPSFASKQFKVEAEREAWIAPARDKQPDGEVRANVLFGWWRDNFQEVDEVAEKALAQLKKDFPFHAHTRKAVADVAKEAITAPGKKAPAFSVKNLEGEDTFTLATFKGKYVLLDFWATWCPYCVAEVPGLHKAFEAYKGKNLEFLSLSCDRKVEDIAPYRAKGNPMPWKHAFLEGGTKGDVAQAYGVTGIPKPVLIGPDGKILAVGTSLRGEKLLETLAKHVK